MQQLQQEVQMSKFKGDVGTIYTQETDDADKRWQVWFEDFNIIGLGNTELEALRDAERVTGEMNALVKQAIAEVVVAGAHAAGD